MLEVGGGKKISQISQIRPISQVMVDVDTGENHARERGRVDAGGKT
jgi:hypothetical protein